MKVGVPREVHPGERRVGATPETVLRLRKLGFEVVGEAGGGEGGKYSDGAYAEGGGGVAAGVPGFFGRPGDRGGEDGAGEGAGDRGGGGGAGGHRGGAGARGDRAGV